MPKIAITQENTIVCYLDEYQPSKYLNYKIILEVSAIQMLQVLDMSDEDQQRLVKEILSQERESS